MNGSAHRDRFFMAEAIRIIGIDPGLRKTLAGVHDSWGNSCASFARHRSNRTTSLISLRLNQLYSGLERWLHEYSRFEAAVENIRQKECHGDIKARTGRASPCWRLSRAGLRVWEYAPNAVKKNRDRCRYGRQEADFGRWVRLCGMPKSTMTVARSGHCSWRSPSVTRITVTCHAWEWCAHGLGGIEDHSSVIG